MGACILFDSTISMSYRILPIVTVADYGSPVPAMNFALGSIPLDDSYCRLASPLDEHVTYHSTHTGSPSKGGSQVAQRQQRPALAIKLYCEILLTITIIWECFPYIVRSQRKVCSYKNNEKL